MAMRVDRHRRLRSSPGIRQLVSETHLSASDFLVPLFIVEGDEVVEEISSMPGYYRRSLDKTLQEISKLYSEGLQAYLLFVQVPLGKRDNSGVEALAEDGLMQRSIRTIKDRHPDSVIFTDVALDPYSQFGHDGIVEGNRILNDETVEVLARMAVSHAVAGADIMAPSDMMDGRVAAIRQALDSEGFIDRGIMSYSAKYASALYGPFRDALDSAPAFGDKRTYQMDPANTREALREIQSDINEGADILMIKPALPYLDIISSVKLNFKHPLAAYQVSGEYAMIKAAADNGWLNHDLAVMESLISIKRAGADLIATYFAREAIRLFNL